MTCVSNCVSTFRYASAALKLANLQKRILLGSREPEQNGNVREIMSSRQRIVHIQDAQIGQMSREAEAIQKAGLLIRQLEVLGQM